MTALQIDQHLNVEILKRDLEPWKGAIVSAYRVLTWEKNYYCVLVFGGISVIYFMLWYLALSVITMISLLAWLIIIIDYLLPTISRLLLSSVIWDEDHEAKYESVCGQIYSIKTIWNAMDKYLFMERKSAMLVIMMSSLLLGFAWMGAVVDNLLLMYLATLLTATWAGMQDNYVLKSITQAILFGKMN
ncbi:ADP-ribosylation factor-like protein 6-interacting protein 1 [Drosophila obscura]|uniref:ADP-ribosylation factor-like protein 6-interacting protein 1 n=1 Tax=Drosophila obscura TaxID=7282 RepID=UPI000B9FAEBD|nr:ADP-ribosylation factor-like protein 6-interacting protein 1 [Drosophila obscura]